MLREKRVPEAICHSKIKSFASDIVNAMNTWASIWIWLPSLKKKFWWWSFTQVWTVFQGLGIFFFIIPRHYLQSYSIVCGVHETWWLKKENDRQGAERPDNRTRCQILIFGPHSLPHCPLPSNFLPDFFLIHSLIPWHCLLRLSQPEQRAMHVRVIWS